MPGDGVAAAKEVQTPWRSPDTEEDVDAQVEGGLGMGMGTRWRRAMKR